MTVKRAYVQVSEGDLAMLEFGMGMAHPFTRRARGVLQGEIGPMEKLVRELAEDTYIEPFNPEQRPDLAAFISGVALAYKMKARELLGMSKLGKTPQQQQATAID